jgi:ribonuclease VapC
MFVDASALVAILTNEPEAHAFVNAIDGADRATTSAIALFEASAAIRRKRPGDAEDIADDLRFFLARAKITVEPITEEVGYAAAEVQSRYGKGSGHPARLNLGDCFAYAMAKQHKVPLLYKGDDFSLTDLA